MKASDGRSRDRAPLDQLRQDRELIARGAHADPHSVLGAHEQPDGVAFRVWRPGATRVLVRAQSGAELELRDEQLAGFFEGSLRRGEPRPERYQLEITYEDGNRLVTRDPYSFAPTLGELDLHLASEGRHEELYARLGAHLRELEGASGTAFAVWAPDAAAVSVLGDFNLWSGSAHQLRSLGGSGIWELFVPEAAEGARYKFELLTRTGERRTKADPLAFRAELPPGTASEVAAAHHAWRDEQWIERRASSSSAREPVSIYELHLGSWRRGEHGEELGYRELARQLGPYVRELGFTHVELLPVMAHPFAGSWGYQTTSYFAPDPRFGSPDELREFIDELHALGIGVILDWVPAHFPRDDWALARFDGSALYEHADRRRGEHPDWGTLVFNFGRNEVRNFLIASALFWLREYHADGLRVDAVASMLYRDYSRAAGEWVPNEHGGREDLEAVAFLRELDDVVHRGEPGAITAAEESTAWPGVSRQAHLGGLGFDFKWNMGWMHDTLEYFAADPIYRRYRHHELTFSLVYAFSEQFILPLSHDEVVHGKRSLIEKMPGDRWQRFANLRALYAYMWSHPGKQLLFMGGEFAQEREWSHERSLDWQLLERPEHRGIQTLVRDLNRVYRAVPALWRRDCEGDAFSWLEPNDADANVLAFTRRGDPDDPPLVCVCNLSPLVRSGYRIGLPLGGRWLEALNTDSSYYGGSDVGNAGALDAEPLTWHAQPYSAALTLPPLAVLWLVPDTR